MAKGAEPRCPWCGEHVVLVSIRCGADPGRDYRCQNAFGCGWRTGKPIKKPGHGSDGSGN